MFDPGLEKVPYSSRSCWSKADQFAKDEYKKVLGQKLTLIGNTEFCNNIHCSSIDHLAVIEEYTTTVLEAMEAAGKSCLPRLQGYG